MTFIEVSGIELDELRERLRHARRATDWPERHWEGGITNAELDRLTDRWQQGFDWSTVESELNALPFHQAQVGDSVVGYLRFDAEDPSAPAIVITHGWPSSVLELVPLAERLSQPSRHGAEGAAALTVIVPALPGFPGSPQRISIAEPESTHHVWHQLMTEHLGFERYFAHGGDLGAGISARLGESYPEAVLGIHVLAVAPPASWDESSLTDEEREHLATVAGWDADEGGYMHEQRTRPLTLAHALADSPRGLLAWILEKHRAWSDSDGDVTRRFPDDYLLTLATLYWVTNSISTSFRPYAENYRGTLRPVKKVTVPTAVAVFPKDLNQPPRSWAERTFNVAQYTRMPSGGHFGAFEEPELLAADIQKFVRSLKPATGA